jgi:hypothetical protein
MTWAARVGLGREKEIRARRPPPEWPAALDQRARATGWAGTRTPTVGRPAVTSRGTWSAFGNTSVKRARPEAGGQRLGRCRQRAADVRRLLHVRHVHDQRIVRGASLRREEPRHGAGVERVDAKAVDGLGGKRHETATAKALGRTTDGGRIGVLGIDDDYLHGRRPS